MEKLNNKQKRTLSQESRVLSLIRLSIICFFILAIIEPDIRPNFAELAKLGITGIVGWLCPRTEES